MADAIGARPVEAWLGDDLVCILENEVSVRNAKPDQAKLAGLDSVPPRGETCLAVSVFLPSFSTHIGTTWQCALPQTGSSATLSFGAKERVTQSNSPPDG